MHSAPPRRHNLQALGAWQHEQRDELAPPRQGLLGEVTWRSHRPARPPTCLILHHPGHDFHFVAVENAKLLQSALAQDVLLMDPERI